MNCFEWQSRASDYLDGTLAAGLKKDADEHVDRCEECSDRYKHYRIILSSIASQPRSSLPIPIRKAPFSAVPRFERGRGRSRWDRIPWYIRTTLEGTGIVLLILVGISVGPRLRALYERKMETNLNEFNESMNSPDLTDSSAASLPLARGKVTPASAEIASDHGDAFSGEEEGDSDENGDDEVSDHEIRVGHQEIWRFNLKTDSPHEFRAKIVETLANLKISPETPGFPGIEAPGGIQFDLFIPRSAVPGLKRQLQKIAPKPPAELANTPMGETFTWYKNKSKKKIPDGTTRVVIWLSQM